MTAALRHQILEDDRVLVTSPAMNLSVRVSQREARRFAWALLADLDPDEAYKAGYEPPPSPAIRRVERTPEERGSKGPWQLNDILAVLKEHGELSTPQIANRLGVASQHASVQLSRLKRRGYVVMIGRGSPNYPASWNLADPDVWVVTKLAHDAKIVPKNIEPSTADHRQITG